MRTVVCLFGLGLYAQNVGIGTPSPTERLHVAGNLRLDGAFMPGNNPGTPGQVLLSAGTNTPPVWHMPFGAPCGPAGATANRLVRWTSANQYCNSILADNGARVWNADVVGGAPPAIPGGSKFYIQGSATDAHAVVGVSNGANVGVWGLTRDGEGVEGQATGAGGWGVVGWGNAANTIGVLSIASDPNNPLAVAGFVGEATLLGISLFGNVAGNFVNWRENGTGVLAYVGVNPTGYVNTAGSFRNDEPNGTGVLGVATMDNGTGVLGAATNANNPTGVAGYVGDLAAMAGSLFGNVAGNFVNRHANGTGVVGVATNATNPTGVAGYVGNAPSIYVNAAGSFRNDLANGIGVWGVATNATNPTGVAGYLGVGTTPLRYVDAAGSFYVDNSRTGDGVVGRGAGNGSAGVVGIAPGGNNTNWGVLSIGNLVANGAKPFVIDHPFDPENKFLYHYAIESTRPYNMYMGTVVTDAQGLATVELPHYFEAINKDPHYVLTPIGTFAQAIVKEEIQNNRFVIQTDKPHVKVTWMVYATRNDVYVRHFAPWALGDSPDEVEKPDNLKGKYAVPELFGKDESYAYKPVRRVEAVEGKAMSAEGPQLLEAQPLPAVEEKIQKLQQRRELQLRQVEKQN